MSKDLRNQNIDERNLGYSYDSDFIENCDICACLDEVVNEEPTLSTIMMLYCKYQYETTGSLDTIRAIAKELELDEEFVLDAVKTFYSNLKAAAERSKTASVKKIG